MLDKSIVFLKAFEGEDAKVSLTLGNDNIRTKVTKGKTVGITLDRENKTAYLSDKNTGII